MTYWARRSALLHGARRWRGEDGLARLRAETRDFECARAGGSEFEAALQALAGGGGGPEGGASIEQQAKVLAEVLLEMSRARFLILLIEDAEHLDETSKQVVGNLVEAVAEPDSGLRLFLLVAVRSGRGVVDGDMARWVASEQACHEAVV